MSKLEGKVAVITGGNSGIGLATAQRFVAEGAYVFITGRRQSELDAAVKQIGKNITAVQGDVSNLADLDRLYATVKQQKGHIDILFANAGTGQFAPLSRKKNSCGCFSNFRGEPATISASYKKLLLGFVNFWLQKHVLELVENVSKGIRLFRKFGPSLRSENSASKARRMVWRCRLR
jgi:NAD(P)-dependent dehydrogenase (short-subunit alcohol dehydrogenase family)